MKKKFTLNTPYVLWGITALAVIAISITIFLGASHWRTITNVLKMVGGILAPVVYGLCFAYLLNKPIAFFERTVFKRLREKKPEKAAKARRTASITTVMLIVLALLGGAISLLIPQIVNSIERLVNRLPMYFNIAMEWLSTTLADNPELETVILGLLGTFEQNLTEWLKTTLLAQVNTVLSNLTTGVIGFIGEIFNFFVGLVVAVYVQSRREIFGAQVKKLLYAVFRPKAADSLLRGCKFLDFTCGSFISSRLIDALIVGVVCYIVMTIARIPYAVLISVIVGVTNIIPFFGPFIGAIPSATLLLLEDPMKCVVFIIFIIILQQLDGNVLYPRIQGTSLGLSGFWILFAILLFGGLFGFVGFLLGVPIFAAIYSGIKHFANMRLTEKGMPTATYKYKGPDAPAYAEALAEADATNDETAMSRLLAALASAPLVVNRSVEPTAIPTTAPNLHAAEDEPPVTESEPETNTAEDDAERPMKLRIDPTDDE